MATLQNKLPDYLFETSWEICNKVGGIHTVISSKAGMLAEILQSNHIMIGPDVWRGETPHPEFVEDDNLYKEWKDSARKAGLKIKVGRWKIPNEPVAILVDFSPYIVDKDHIFAKFWELYRLDSLSGQWDYIEPALFGYAAGKVIEHFVKFNFTGKESSVAQFHEWVTGSGVLYLKEYLPQVATAFTAHATVTGRILADKNMSLYSQMEKYNAEQVAKDLNFVAKHSLESSAALQADAFTTVSDLTLRECEHFLARKADSVTPNGIPEGMISSNGLEGQKKDSRQKLLSVAQNMLGYDLPEDAVLLGTAGRYEYRNKGFDLLTKALNKLNHENSAGKTFVSFFFVPAGHRGADKELIKRMKGTIKGDGPLTVSHNLNDPDFDPVMKGFQEENLNNDKKSAVKVLFIPCYLDGSDGVIDLTYYEALKGLDISVFPSYYEPWGYTPLESLAFEVPTITTSLSGFGAWVNQRIPEKGKGVFVINRNDDNDSEVTNEIFRWLNEFAKLSEKELQEVKQKASEIARNAVWDNFISHYTDAYKLALDKAGSREKVVEVSTQTTPAQHVIQRAFVNEPVWRTVEVLPELPGGLKKLEELTSNLWWCWDDEACELLESIDEFAWTESGRNPINFFEEIDYNRLIEVGKDKEFNEKLDSIYHRFRQYMDAKSEARPRKIAYFSMEYGLHDSIKIYSGGLGLLAGDYLKEASDRNYDMVAFGLLYRYGYFRQLVTVYGEQLAEYDYQHFSKLPIKPVLNQDGSYKTVNIQLPGRTVYIRMWQVEVGRISLYLLDTDFDFNQPGDREITHMLYGGDQENRLKQEIILGIGGIRAIEELGFEPDLYHSNEGHSAFIGLERLRKLIRDENLSFFEAKEVVRASTLFTTHTPVPAGHDSFSEDLVRTYMSHYPERLKISWDDFMSLGRAKADDWSEKFNMSFLAANMSQQVNGVSMLHGEVTKDMFAKLWKGYLPDELHIDYVTNGVHLSFWAANQWLKLYREEFGEEFFFDQANKKYWKKIHKVSDEKVWNLKNELRKALIKAIKQRLESKWLKRNRNPRNVVKIMDALSNDALTIVFARRFATYKRAHLLFNNPDRLAEILNNEDHPVQILFAGKAHPQDKAGQELIRKIMEMSREPRFMGKILFLQNYDIDLAKRLVQGADIWINTPTRPLEASGTSGQKAVMNGGLHFSVLDGWWVEGYQPDAGWALPKERTFDDQEFQDELDAEKVYSIIENEIVPAYYNRNKNGIPEQWIGFIKNSIADVAPKFTTTRMLRDYEVKFYAPLYERSKKIQLNEYEEAREIAAWKKRISHAWDSITVISSEIVKGEKDDMAVGSTCDLEVELALDGLNPEEVGVEVITTKDMRNIVKRKEYDLVSHKNGKAVYKTKLEMTMPGTFNCGVRIFPKNSLLPHRQDTRFLKWL